MTDNTVAAEADTSLATTLTKRLTPMQLKNAARLAAVQALYQMDLTQAPSKSVVFEFQNFRFGHEDEPGYTQADERFFELLVTGVVAHQSDIDVQLSRSACPSAGGSRVWTGRCAPSCAARHTS